MRWVIAALALGLAACDGTTTVTTDSGSASAPGGYTLEIRATEAVQSYLVITPEGRTVGARAADGASALMEAGRAQALAGEPPPEGVETPEVMSIRLPGFQMAIGASEEDANGDNGSVSLSFGGAQNIIVRANEGGPGDADDVAFVRISGVDAAAVRDFITDADELSPAVQAQMLAELGLE